MKPRSRIIVTITGVVYGLVGLALACGGAWLAALGGSVFYIVAGLGILITGGLLIAGHRSALWVYAAVLIGTLIWAVAESGSIGGRSRRAATSSSRWVSGCLLPGSPAILVMTRRLPAKPSRSRSGPE
jgi:hypothetical protein